jgi:hypothetical protein
MKRKLFLACLATAALAQPATATAGGCVNLTDPAGDERDIPAAAPGWGATDVLAVDLVASAGDVTVTFALTAPADPPPGLNYEYGVTFEDADVVWELQAGIDGGAHIPLTGEYELFWHEKNPPPPPPDPVSVESQRSHRISVSGSVDLANNLVTITAPASAFGVPSFAEGRAWTVTYVETMRGALGAKTGPIDDITVDAQLVAGDGSCA